MKPGRCAKAAVVVAADVDPVGAAGGEVDTAAEVVAAVAAVAVAVDEAVVASNG
jgi:hypothetical protein